MILIKDMSDKRPSISVFFPFLNDWGTVGSLIGLAVETVEKLTDDWEVIIINDGSKNEDRQALGTIVDLLNIKYQISKTCPKCFAYRSRRVKNTDQKSKIIKIIDHKKKYGIWGSVKDGV